MESRLDPAGSADRDWEAFYRAGDTPWDKGRAHPALIQWLSKNRLTGDILLPGSGAGHDARALSRDPEARVVGLDFAASAKILAESFPKIRSESYVIGDFLSGASVVPHSFDAVFEHTCFCAIPPGRRRDYARAVNLALRPGGLFLAIFYRNPADRDGGGPPFGCSMKEVDQLFGCEFQLVEERNEIATFEGREHREVLRLMQKTQAGIPGNG